MHVKLSEHFLDQACVRQASNEELVNVMRILTARRLEWAIPRLKGRRGAVQIGPESVLVFCQDDHDDEVIALLTILRGGKIQSLTRRYDTVRVRLSEVT